MMAEGAGTPIIENAFGVLRQSPAVQRMLGHAKASMTLDTYADLFDADLDGVADRLDAAIQATADALRTASEA